MIIKIIRAYLKSRVNIITVSGLYITKYIDDAVFPALAYKRTCRRARHSGLDPE